MKKAMTLEELRAAIDAAVWEQDWHEAFLPLMPKAPDNLVLKSDNPQLFNAIHAELNMGQIDKTKLDQDLLAIRAAYLRRIKKS